MGSDNPPKLEKDTVYSVWKRDVKIWQLGTSVDAKKQAARVVLRMSGKVRDFANRIPLTDLGKDTGLDDLLTELDKHYRKDVTQELFLSIENLETYRRDASKGETIADYIEEFGRRNDRVKELIGNKDAYDDGVLAYRLLKQASLSESDRKLVRATVPKLTYDEMVDALIRCLGDGAVLSHGSESSGANSQELKIKSEPRDNFHAKDYAEGQDEWHEDVYFQNRDFSGRGKNWYRGRGDSSRYNSGYRRSGGNQSYYQKNNNRYSNSSEEQRENSSGVEDSIPNPENSKDPRTGEVRRCNICDSKFHYARDCVHWSDRNDRY